ncbi:helix-turn-helix domain-containing protein [Aliivibrio fischeri]|nr:helix-turn-helix domain-containing protein [Aliivibrio fischeri]TDM54103.1 XRE family transcriptional regulator [Aliivibrio fischeri]TGA72038.1 XRE family transcriptional regulator [Aliivibrio fischeri]
MRGIQVSLGKRLKAVIKEEGLSQRAFAERMNLSVTAIEHYIAERRTPSGELFIEMGKSERFRKYTMWLLTGSVEPNSGQVCPAFSTQEKCGLTAGEEDTLKKG